MAHDDPMQQRLDRRSFIEYECQVGTAEDDPFGHLLHGGLDEEVKSWPSTNTNASPCDSGYDTMLERLRIQRLDQEAQRRYERAALTDKRQPLDECILFGAALYPNPWQAINETVVIDEARLEQVVDSIFAQPSPYAATSVERTAKLLSSPATDPFVECQQPAGSPGGETDWTVHRCRHAAIIRAATALGLRVLTGSPTPGAADVLLLRRTLHTAPPAPPRRVEGLFKSALFRVMRLVVAVLNTLANGPWDSDGQVPVDACWPRRQLRGRRRTAPLALVAGVQLLECLRDRQLLAFVADPQAWDLEDVANAILKMGALLRLLSLVARVAGSETVPSPLQPLSPPTAVSSPQTPRTSFGGAKTKSCT